MTNPFVNWLNWLNWLNWFNWLNSLNVLKRFTDEIQCDRRAIECDFTPDAEERETSRLAGPFPTSIRPLLPTSE